MIIEVKLKALHNFGVIGKEDKDYENN